MNRLVVFFTLLWRISIAGQDQEGGGGGYDYYDYHQLDYHRPRDRQIALHLQAKAVENQGFLFFLNLIIIS